MMKIWNVCWRGSVYKYMQVATDDDANEEDALEVAETRRLEFLDSVNDVDAEDWEPLEVKRVRFK